MADSSNKRLVIVGAGFGGLSLAKSLKNADVEITLIDKNNHHLFQPLLYQVATAALSPGDIAQPIRTELRGHKNVQVIMDEVIDIDKSKNRVITTNGEISYDYLVLASGNTPNYFGNDDWAKHSVSLKNLDDAVKMRELILRSFEKAERNYNDEKEYKKLTNFVIIGGGPTGVELAGAISEIARKTILEDFPLIIKSKINITLIEGGDELLKGYYSKLTSYTKETLEKMYVNVLLNTSVTDIQHELVKTDSVEIESANIIWAAGNKASDLIDKLETEQNKAGQAIVQEDLSIGGHSNIFVIGDAASVEDKTGKQIPGIAPAAIQQGKFIAKLIKTISNGKKRPSFKYFDKGMMATIGRAKAVVESGKLQLTGFFAWLAWGLVHIFFLIDFRNRLKVILEWFWYYITFKPGANLIFHNPSGKKPNNKVKKK